MLMLNVDVDVDVECYEQSRPIAVYYDRSLLLYRSIFRCQFTKTGDNKRIEMCPYSAFDTTGKYEFLLRNTVLYLNKSYLPVVNWEGYKQLREGSRGVCLQSPADESTKYPK